MIIVSLEVRTGNVFVLTAIRVHMYNLHFRALCNCSGNKVTTLLPPPPPPKSEGKAYDSCTSDYPKRPIRQQRHSRLDRIAFYLYDRDDAIDKLYDKWKLPETTHMTEATMWKPGVLTIYKNHPVGNFRHKHKTIKCEVAGERITIKYIHIS